MIPKAKAMSYGINVLRYILTNHDTRSIQEKHIEYWTVCYPLN